MKGLDHVNVSVVNRTFYIIIRLLIIYYIFVQQLFLILDLFILQCDKIEVDIFALEFLNATPVLYKDWVLPDLVFFFSIRFNIFDIFSILGGFNNYGRLLLIFCGPLCNYLIYFYFVSSFCGIVMILLFNEFSNEFSD